MERKPVMDKLPAGRKHTIPPRIAERMRELALQGYSIEELANIYLVSERTVKRYLKGLNRKAGRRSEALKAKLNPKLRRRM